MILVLFLIILLEILYLTFQFQKKDVFSPSVLMILGYMVTTTFAICNLSKWKTDVSIIALCLIIVGIISFIIGEKFAGYIGNRQFVRCNENKIGKQLNILAQYSKKGIIFIAIIICLLCARIVYKEIIRIAYSDFKTWGNLVYNYKVNKAKYDMSGLGRLSEKTIKAISYTCLFIFMNNISQDLKINLKIIKNNLLYIVPGIVYSVVQLVLGVRISVLGFMIAGLFFLILCRYYKYGVKTKIRIGTMIKMSIVLIVICVVFFYIKELIGRQQVSNGVFDYIATYLGGSIDLFGQYIRNPMEEKGKVETLAGVIDNMQSYFGILKKQEFTTSLEFRNALTGITIGNTYTGFRNYYNDGGIFGIVFFSNLLGMIFGGVYHLILNYRRMSYFRMCMIIIFGSQLYCIPFHFFTDYFFLKISLNMLLEILLIMLFVYVFMGRKIKKYCRNTDRS